MKVSLIQKILQAGAHLTLTFTEVIESIYNKELSICINISKIKVLNWKRRTKYKSTKRNKEREIWEKL